MRARLTVALALLLASWWACAAHAEVRFVPLANASGGNRLYVADTEAECPTTGAANGDVCIALDTGKIIKRTAGSNIAAVAFSSLTGSLACAQLPPFTGNVTTSAGSCSTTIGNGVVTNAMLAALSYTKVVFVATCAGTATASSTLYLFPIGQLSALTCTITTPTAGIPMPTAGTLKNLTVKVGTGGKAGDAVTVLKGGSATGMPTCVYGTGTTCSDLLTAGAVVAGDLITVKLTTAASDTTANVQVTFELWN